MNKNHDTILCSVYRSPKQEGMYLYVAKQDLFAEVPEELLTRFGTPGHVMDLHLTPDKKLARVSAKEVLQAVADKGFYLQMPPNTTF